MNKIVHKIIINKPVNEVFNASLDPHNTPHWIDGIVQEQASDSPVKLGTIYKNRGNTGDWNFYTVTAFKQNETFTLSSHDTSYNVRYILKSLENNKTEFEYCEWVEEGELENPLPIDAIKKLKQLIED
jgi:hypothetical protein